MALNLSTVFGQVDTVLNELLSKYVSIQFIGFNQADDNKPYYLLDEPITTGFYYKERKVPSLGQVVETLRLVPETDEIKTLLSTKKIKMVELREADGNFMRFSLETLKEPHPPKFEWLYHIKPNRQEQTVIT